MSEVKKKGSQKPKQFKETDDRRLTLLRRGKTTLLELYLARFLGQRTYRAESVAQTVSASTPIDMVPVTNIAPSPHSSETLATESKEYTVHTTIRVTHVASTWVRSALRLQILEPRHILPKRATTATHRKQARPTSTAAATQSKRPFSSTPSIERLVQRISIAPRATLVNNHLGGANRLLRNVLLLHVTCLDL